MVASPCRQQDRDMTTTTRTGAITGPDQIHQAFLQATNSDDVDALLNLYDPDGIAVQLDGGQCTGAAAMRAMFTDLTGMIRHIDGGTRKVFIAGDLALTSGT
jgi:ketosteroid isomerase-like protein